MMRNKTPNYYVCVLDAKINVCVQFVKKMFLQYMGVMCFQYKSVDFFKKNTWIVDDGKYSLCFDIKLCQFGIQQRHL